MPIYGLPEEEETPEEPDDVAGDTLQEDEYGGPVAPELLSTTNSEGLLAAEGGATGYCTTLDMQMGMKLVRSPSDQRERNTSSVR